MRDVASGGFKRMMGLRRLGGNGGNDSDIQDAENKRSVKLFTGCSESPRKKGKAGSGRYRREFNPKAEVEPQSSAAKMAEPNISDLRQISQIDTDFEELAQSNFNLV